MLMLVKVLLALMFLALLSGATTAVVVLTKDAIAERDGYLAVIALMVLAMGLLLLAGAIACPVWRTTTL